MIYMKFDLRKYRKSNGMTQCDLAEKLGMNQAMVSYYERNWRTVKYSTILQIAKKLNVNLEELFTPLEKGEVEW